ncbi:MAG: hypothetical protein ABSB74_04415 [Tepidisphaeraceae bacterium]
MKAKRRLGSGGNSKLQSLRNRNRHVGCVEPLERRLLLSSTSYTWQNAAIGAGGFVDGVFFDPNNNGVMYARTDIGGLYKSTNGGNNWQALLDFVGNSTSNSGNGTTSSNMQVLGFAIDPENSNNIYALVGGAVLYSTNAGQSWGIDNSIPGFSSNGNGPARGTGERIAVDPFDSNIVLIGSNATNGVWESTNAGVSFTKLTGIATGNEITFVAFDPYGGTVGNPDQTIFVGLDSNSTGSNLYETTTGAGGTWTQVGNTGGSASQYPMRLAFDSSNDGMMYLTYSNQVPPEGTISTAGGVWQYNLGTSTWVNITPPTTSGYVGLGVDAENPGTIVVTTFDHYSTGDLIYRTTNANAATPTWVALYGGTATRNTADAPYMAAFTDGIGNWAATTAIDPFNPAHIVYGTGQGLWTTLTGNSSSTLTAANSWYFLDDGIDFTAVLGLNGATSGVPLFTAVGDVNGFAFTTMTSSPVNGAIIPGGSIGTMDSISSAATNASDDVIVGTTGSEDGAYSTNDGASWTEFSSKPSGASGGNVAVSSTGGSSMTIVWAPSGKAPFYSTNNGATWTASGGSPAKGGTVMADYLNPSDFYYYANGKVYFSSNSGATFTIETSFAPSSGSMAVNPFVTGDLWISASGGIYHSTNDGASFTEVSTGITPTSIFALGAPAPGQTVPAIYSYGTVGTFRGFYRSDDGGLTWTLINDTSHQWGGIIDTMAADPETFGRVYIGVNGRGVIVGTPASSLPANWVDTDIYTPGDAGWSDSSTTLSNGTVDNQWIVDGGGAGITGNSVSVVSITEPRGIGLASVVTASPNGFNVGDLVTISGATPTGYDGTFPVLSVVSSTNFTFTATPSLGSASGTITAATNDQFNFASEPISGNAIVSAQLLRLTNADGGNGTPEAGVMIRSSTDDNDPFVAMVQTASNSLEFEYRATTGGGVTAVSLGSVPVGSEYLEIVRNGGNFSGYYSSDGVTWTQLGSTVAIAAMPTTANVGLAASADFNSQLTTATFNNVNETSGPTVATPAAATPNPVTGTSTALSALGSENGSDTGLTYTWAATGPASVSYSGNTNGTDAAKNITANFTQAGSYNFTVTISDSGGLFTTSSVAVTVQQTPTGVIVTPSSATVATGSTQQFSANATDQFGNAISSPTFGWSITGTGNGNSISTTGLATLGSTPGTYTVTAALGSASNNASVTAATAPIVSAFQVNDGNVQRAMVDSLTVTFNEAVTLSAGAITLNLLSQTGGSPTPITNFNLNSPDGGTTWVLTFTDPSYIGGSLPDGAYELIVSAGGVTSGQGLNMSANQNFTFWRLYGDFQGLGTVNGGDFTSLVTELGTQTNSSDWYLDYEGQGTVSGSDFTEFVTRLGDSISIPALPSVELLTAAPAVTTSTSTTTTTTKQKTGSIALPSVAAVTKPVGKQRPRHGHGR